MLGRLCGTRLVEEPWECQLSGVKVSGAALSPSLGGCTYVEISQGYYAGLMPGYVDAQCLYCGGELRCRYGLQKRVCSSSGPVKAAFHLSIEDVGGLVRKLSEVEGDFVWCLTGSGEVKQVFL